MKKENRKMMRKLILICFVMLMFAGCAAEKENEVPVQPEAETGIRIETVETGSFSMDYFRFGNGKKTFVILPGLSVQSVMGFADSVAEAYRVLCDDYTVYLFDRRKKLPESYSVHEMATDTAEAFRALGLKDISLFGASQGGMIAMEIAMNEPELIENLVLGSTSACVKKQQYQTIEKWADLAKAGEKEELYLAFGEAIYPKEVYEQSKQLLIDAAETVTDEDLERFIILAEGINGFDVSQDLEKIGCPVLVLGSKDDQVLGADASIEIVEHFKDRDDFVIYMYDGYGHAVYDLAPDYKERILEFFHKA